MRKKTAKEAKLDAPEVDALVARYVELRNTRDNLDTELREISNKLIEKMQHAEVKTHKTATGSSVTVTTRTATTLDETILRKRLGAQLWNKVTTRALDRRKLDAFVKSGEVKSSDVAMAMSETASTPYVTVRR